MALDSDEWVDTNCRVASWGTINCRIMPDTGVFVEQWGAYHWRARVCS